MGEKLVLRFLGLLELNEYTLEQSHGVSPFSVAMTNTTLEGESACGYPLSKTVRSIEKKGFLEIALSSFPTRVFLPRHPKRQIAVHSASDPPSRPAAESAAETLAVP